MNCVACAIAGDSRLAGNPASALRVGAQPVSILEKMFGGTFQEVSGPMQIGSILSKAGAGARGIVFGSRGAGAIGHVFNAINDNGVIRFPDFQSGMGATFNGFDKIFFLLTSKGT
jgi:hypothetical protein